MTKKKKGFVLRQAQTQPPQLRATSLTENGRFSSPTQPLLTHTGAGKPL